MRLAPDITDIFAALGRFRMGEDLHTNCTRSASLLHTREFRCWVTRVKARRGHRWHGSAAAGRCILLKRKPYEGELCEATGGPCTYTGRSMRDTHAGMETTAGEFDVVMYHLAATFDELNVPETEQDELVGLLMPMRDDIVEVESPATGTPLPDSYQAAPPLM
jgi:hypothetical protein